MDPGSIGSRRRRAAGARSWAMVIALAAGLAGLWLRPAQPACAQEAGRGVGVRVRVAGGQELSLYRESHALLIGVGRYTAGWPGLESVAGELAAVKGCLEKQGFAVEELANPTSQQLRNGVDDFINRWGFAPDNRLLVYFSGHGYTRRDGRKGYIVPADAPDPNVDEVEFARKAVEMEMILVWAKRIEAKHALFLFDSCFSGSVFKAKDLPVPKPISYATANPVREFISAGGAGETVPSKSVFMPSFVRGVNGEADLDGDGYVTGTELGIYLRKKVLAYETGQTPQYGKIKDPDLDEGDFVFAVPAAAGGSGQLAPPPPVVGGLNLGDLEKNAQVRAQWGDYQARMALDATKVTTLEGKAGLTPAEKATAWERFLGAYGVDNPLSADDDVLRTMARDRLAYWQAQPAAGAGGLPEVVTVGPAGPAGQGPPLNPRSGDVWKDTLSGVDFVWIPPGEFWMGSPESEAGRESDEIRHQVILTKGFWLGRTEVTQGQWQAIMGSTPSYFQNAGQYAPVEKVSWNDCQEFLLKLNVRAGRDLYRLPTEAEWEYACRAETKTVLYTGQLTIRGDHDGPELNAIAWYGGNSGVNYTGGIDSSGWEKKQYNHRWAGTHPVGQKQPNKWGLYDMLGNVCEWCLDWYGKYPEGQVADPKGSDSGSAKVFRGGSWYVGARLVRCADRRGYEPFREGNALGLRLARDQSN